MTPIPVTGECDGDADLADRAISVIHVQRRPVAANFSIERVFSAVRAAITPDISVSTWICPRSSSGIWKRLYNLIRVRTLRADVLHITGDVSYLAFTLRGTIVLTVHDLVLLRQFDGWRRQVARLLWYEWPCACARRITTVSEFTRQELIRETSCAPEKIVVISNPLLTSSRPRERRVRAVPHILQIGTAWNKNLVRQTDALRGIPCTVELVGVLSDEHRLAFQRGHISFTSIYGVSDEEMTEKYLDADLLMFASTYEGFGMPIIEAQAMGTPVLTSITSSMPEIAGHGACLVDPTDVAAIRAGVHRILGDADYRESLVRAGRENVLRFTPAVIAQQYEQLYRSLAGAHLPPDAVPVPRT